MRAYQAAIGRVIMVGSPGKEVEQVLAMAIQAQQACFAASCLDHKHLPGSCNGYEAGLS